MFNNGVHSYGKEKVAFIYSITKYLMMFYVEVIRRLIDYYFFLFHANKPIRKLKEWKFSISNI